MSEADLVTLTAKGHSESCTTNKVTVGDFEGFYFDEKESIGGGNIGPNPLEYFLGSLSACTSIMTVYVAKDLNFSYSDITYSATGTLDRRGYQGLEGIQTYFHAVEVTVDMATFEGDEALAALGKQVEARCPLYNLLKDAGVTVTTNWRRK